MLRKEISYKTYDDVLVTEPFYFNLSKAELIELEMGKSGGFAEYLMRILKAEDQQEIMKTFKQMLTMAIGKKSADGKRFVKNDEVRDDFLQSEAYSEFLVELCTDSNAAAEFVNGVMPGGLSDLPMENVQLPTGQELPAWMREDREPTSAELQNMTQAEMIQAFQVRQQKAKAKIDTQLAPDILQ